MSASKGLTSPLTKVSEIEVNKTLPPSADTAQTSPLTAWPEAVAEASAKVASVVGVAGGGGGLLRASVLARPAPSGLADAWVEASLPPPPQAAVVRTTATDAAASYQASRCCAHEESPSQGNTAFDGFLNPGSIKSSRNDLGKSSARENCLAPGDAQHERSNPAAQSRREG